MRLLWWRRKKPEPTSAPTVERGSVATSPRPGGVSGRLAPLVEPRDELLRFTRDLLNARGARVRMEEDDLIIATLTDGATARYTTTLARARAEEETTLLAQGAAALESLFDDAADHSRVVALRLAASADPARLTLSQLAPAPEACGRCAGQGGETQLRGVPSCDTCPLRAGRPALTWEHPPVKARVTGQREAQSVELVYRLIAHDRRGRHDEWLRLAFDSGTGRALPPLPLDLLAAAQASDAHALTAEALAHASERAQEQLRPALEALSASLRQRVTDEYQRRVQDVTATHERLRHERPEEARTVAAALERELASLAEVYGVEVEARLEGVVYIVSPTAQVSAQMADGVGPTVTVDLGRGVVSAPICDVCAEDTRSGHICAQGHTVCATHLGACGHCGATRCPVCEPARTAVCGLCGQSACAECAATCDTCGQIFCADHVWRCAEGDHTLCLEHINACDSCGDPLCEQHTGHCADCDVALCQRHTRPCKTCGEARCATHALTCVTCAQPICQPHSTACGDCGKPVCADDTFACLGCGRTLCAGCAAAAACASCGADYCARCRSESGVCPGCRAPEPLSDADNDALRQAAEREPAINLKHKWQVGRNAGARVFVARGLGREQVWVVTHTGEIAGARRKGWLAR